MKPSQRAFCEHLTGLRKQRKLTLRQAAEQAGISNPYLHQIETGKRLPPRPSILARLAEVYGVPFYDLTMRADYFGIKRTKRQENLIRQELSAMSKQKDYPQGLARWLGGYIGEAILTDDYGSRVDPSETIKRLGGLPKWLENPFLEALNDPDLTFSRSLRHRQDEIPDAWKQLIAEIYVRNKILHKLLGMPPSSFPERWWIQNFD